MRRARPSFLKFLLVLLAVVVLLAVSRTWWLTQLGKALIHNDGPGKADVAVVLAGDQWGQRVLGGAALARDGYVPAVLVSGPPTYDMSECDLAIDFAVHRGFPRDSFIRFPNRALSTREEARDVLAELRKRNVRDFLLVTSDYHTARARRIYRAQERAMGGGPSLRVVAVADRHFRPDSWWRSREGLKIFFMEWSKTVATALGM